MNVKLIKGYVLAAVTLAILAAAIFILLNNIRDEWTAQVFFGSATASVAVWMLACALAGVALWFTLVKLAPRTLAALRAGKRASQAKATQQRLSQLESQQPPPAEAEK